MRGSVADHEALVRAWEKDQTYQQCPASSGIDRATVRLALVVRAKDCGWDGVGSVEEWSGRRAATFLRERGPAHDEPEVTAAGSHWMALVMNDKSPGHPVFNALGEIVGVWMSQTAYAHKGVVSVPWDDGPAAFGQSVVWDEQRGVFSQFCGQGTPFILRSLGTKGLAWIDLG